MTLDKVDTMSTYDELVIIRDKVSTFGEDIKGFELTSDGEYKEALLDDISYLMSLLEDNAIPYQDQSMVDNLFLDIKNRGTVLESSIKSIRNQYIFLVYITDSSSWIHDALEGPERDTFLKINNAFKDKICYKNNIGYFIKNVFKRKCLAAAQNASMSGYEVIITHNKILEFYEDIQLDFSNTEEWTAVLYSIAFGLELKISEDVVNSVKDTTIQVLRKVGHVDIAELILSTKAMSGIIGLVGLELFRLIDISFLSNWNWSDVSSSILLQLNDLHYNLDYTTLVKLRMINVDKYKDLRLLQAIGIQIIKECIIKQLEDK